MSSNNPFGFFWCPHHRRPEDYAFMKAMQPGVLTIQDGSDIDYAWVQKNCPNTLIVARDWALGNQQSDMERDPEGTATHHASEWKKRQAKLGFDPAKTFVAPINEPFLWADDGTDAQRVRRIDAVNRYTVRWLDECARLGLRAGALKLSVGWPNNTGKDTPPDWSIFTGVEAAIKRGRHALIVHSYWADKGPDESWGWWAGRFLKCPWNVPVIIGEAGFEMAVKKPVPVGMRGWMKYISKEQYADQLVDYCNWISWDSRLLGICVFLLDYQNVEWGTLDLMPIMQEVIARKGKIKPIGTLPFEPLPASALRPPKSEAEAIALRKSTQPPTPTPTPPPDNPAPPVTPTPAAVLLRWPLDTVRITQYFGEHPENYAKYGYRGHNGIDLSAVVGTPVKAAADGTVAYVDNDPAGYGLYVRVWHKALRCYTFYGHLSAQHVKQGDAVTQGQVLGLSGNTGNSTGPHVHFEVRVADANGVYDSDVTGMGKAAVDPITFMEGLERGAALPLATRVMLPFVATGAAT